MTKIRVKRTYLVEETIEYNSDIALSAVEETMESGKLFERDAILIGREIESRGDLRISLEKISNPQIVKLEKI